MSRGPVFIKQDVFEDHLRRVPVAAEVSTPT